MGSAPSTPFCIGLLLIFREHQNTKREFRRYNLFCRLADPRFGAEADHNQFKGATTDYHIKPP